MAENQQSSIADSKSYSNSVGLQSFLSSMQNFAYCIPSNNLWTIQIKEHTYVDSSSNDGKSNQSLLSLYSNIISENASWKNNSFALQWEINVDKLQLWNNLNGFRSSYIENLANPNGVFLASNINISPNSIAVDAGIGADLIPHGGFLNFGKAFSTKTANTCNISFFISNYSITDILIDPWIAAIGQRGLIEDNSLGTGSIRADIYIDQYAASIPEKEVTSLDIVDNNIKGLSGIYMNNTKETISKMALLKQIVLYNAFPIQRGQQEYTYDAPKLNNEVVQFQFDEYSITYNPTNISIDTTGTYYPQQVGILTDN